MKFLHTGDWHIGQLFHEYDRTYEHQRFLDWLVATLRDEEVDVLLVSGDVFDLSNPSAASVRQFYTFLSEACAARPEMQIVITAGNHDSASRLEAPKPLLTSSKVHIIGTVDKDGQGGVDFDKLVIPLTKAGKVQAWCLAVPFLRMGDYPPISDCDNPYAEGVARLYHEAFEHVKQKQLPGQAIIAMGHLHARQAETSDMDNMERQIMGGLECIGASAFPGEIAYVALGHIHKAQRVGGQDRIRYCGSPIPMSFSEINYKHQVITFTIEEGRITPPQAIEVPLSVPLLRVPQVHSRLSEVLSALQGLQPPEGADVAPYLQVNVLLDAPEPGLRYKIEEALQGKNVRLARIDTRYPLTRQGDDPALPAEPAQLQALRPEDVFARVYAARYDSEVPEALFALFREAVQQVHQREEQA